MGTLADYRARYPRYKDIPDEQLGKAIYDKHYAGKMPYEAFAQRAGYSVTPAAPKPGMMDRMGSAISNAGTLVHDVARTFQGSAQSGTAGIAEGAERALDPFQRGMKELTTLGGLIPDAQQEEEILASLPPDATEDQIIAAYAESIGRTQARRREAPFEPSAVVDSLRTTGAATQADISPENAAAMRSSGVAGDIRDLSSIKFHGDPSARGLLLQTAGVAGQLAPTIGAALATRGASLRTQMGTSAGVAAAQTGGAAGHEEQQRILDMEPQELYQIPAFYERVEAGMDPEEARLQVADEAGRGAFQAAAPVGAVSGVLTAGVLSGPGQSVLGRVFGGASPMARAVKGAIADAPLEAGQEVVEGLAQRGGAASATREDRNIWEGTAGEAFMGALGGATTGAVGGVVDPSTPAAGTPVEPGAPPDPTTLYEWRDDVPPAYPPAYEGGGGRVFDEAGNVVQDGAMVPAGEPGMGSGMMGPAGDRMAEPGPDFVVDSRGTASRPADAPERAQERAAAAGGPGMGPAVEGTTMEAPDIAQAAFDSALEVLKSETGKAPTAQASAAIAQRIAAKFDADPAALLERNRNPIKAPPQSGQVIQNNPSSLETVAAAPAAPAISDAQLSIDPTEQPESFGLPKRMMARQRKREPKDFDEHHDDVLDFVALNGGLDRDAWKTQGVDPANWNSVKAQKKNKRFGPFSPPVFRSGKGMTPGELRLKLEQNGFLAQDTGQGTTYDDEAIQMVLSALNQDEGFYTHAGQETQTAIKNIRGEQARINDEMDKARELRTNVEAMYDEASRAEAKSEIRANRVVPMQHEREAMAMVELYQAIRDAGGTEAEVDAIHLEYPTAERAKPLWSLLQEKRDANERRATQEGEGAGVQTPSRPAAPAPSPATPAAAVEVNGQASGASATQPDEVNTLRDRVAALERELRTDALTGIPNKSAFDEDADLGWPSVAAIDMDGLKRLNDTIGHDPADAVLKRMASELQARRQDDSARFYRRSGDEFAARFKDQATADQVMAEVQQALESVIVRLSGVESGEYDYHGIGISYGLGADYVKADDNASIQKRERLKAGIREEARTDGAPRRLKPVAVQAGRESDRVVPEGLTNAPAEDSGSDDPGGQSNNQRSGVRENNSGGNSRAEGAGGATSRDSADAAAEAPSGATSESGIAAAAAEAATSPTNDKPATPAMLEAGNYAKGHIKLHGLDISIENPAGTKRRPEWPALTDHYGYIRKTEGADGEHVDAFIGKRADNASLPVFVIDQVDPKTGKFDEHKVMIGWASPTAARGAYLSNYSKGWKGVGAITRMTLPEFKAWLQGDTTKPAASAAQAAPAKERTNASEVSSTAAQQEADARKEGGQRPDAPARQAGLLKGKIDDFGEKLHGARKDYAAQLRDAVADVDLAAEPLSKSWPEPDYQKLLDAGADPAAVSWVRAARDEIPNKPQSSWKLSGWVPQVRMLRDLAGRILDGTLPMARVNETMSDQRYWRTKADVGGRAKLYEAVGHGTSLKGVRLTSHSYSFYKGVKYSPAKTMWAVEKEGKATALSNWPNELAVADTEADAIAAFVAKMKAQPEATAVPRTKAVDFIVYRRPDKPGVWYVGKKIGRETIDLHETTSVKEAREFLTNNQPLLEERLRRYKETPFERGTENRPRVGGDHRNGAPVTPEVFADAFGFRGVQFGNYVENNRRQSDLNEAYDALMDLAAVLGVPPRSLSLNGRLGLAFGARGHGGNNAPAAHYEPGNVVINLTKGGGPGSLAHEWWHALDNYFAKSGGVKGYGTDAPREALKIRDEMRDAFYKVKQATRQPGLLERSRELDKRRAKPYWATPWELSARSFESYVVAKLQDQSASNDYLSNVINSEAWDSVETGRAAALGTQPGSTFPYPNAAEMPAVRTAFDAFFDTVESRPTDGGNVELYSQSGGAAGAGVPMADLEAMVSKLAVPGVSVRIVETGAELPAPSATAEGWTDGSGTVYLVRSNLRDIDHARVVLAHEVAGHIGVERVIGPEWPNVQRIIESMRTERGFHAQSLIDAVRETARRYPDATPEQFAREAVAVMAERGVTGTLWDRIVAAVRRWARKALNRLQWTDAEVRDLLRRGRAAAGTAAGASTTAAGGAYSMRDPAAALAAEFKQQTGTDINTAGARLAGVEMRNTMRRNGNPAGATPTLELEPSPYTPEQVAMHEQWRSMQHPSSKYLFHATPRANLESIRQNGLVAGSPGRFDGVSTGRLSLSANEAVASYYVGADGVLLRVTKGRDVGDLESDLFAGGDGAYTTSENIPPEALEVQVDGKWVPLTKTPPMYSQPAPAGGFWSTPVKSRLDNILYELQDRHIDTKRVQAAIKAFGTQVADAQDVYAAETVYHGRAAKRTADFLNRELQPLLDALAKAKIPLAEFEAYLHARHAPERNRVMAERNPSQAVIDRELARIDAAIKAATAAANAAPGLGAAAQLNAANLTKLQEERARWESAVPFYGTEDQRLSLSGMSDADAAQVMAAMSPERAKQMSAMADLVDSIVDRTRHLMVSYGLDSADAVSAMESTYDYYIPLMRADMDQDGNMPGSATGFSVKGSSVKAATGSNRQVVDIVSNLARQRERVIDRGEKNRVANAVVGLAETAPNPDFWLVDTPPMKKRLDPETGFVVSEIDPSYKSSPNVLVARTPRPDGSIRERVVIFNKKSERATRAAIALKNLDGAELHRAIQVVGMGTRFLAAMSTQYNIIFGLKNFERDLQSAMLNLTSTTLNSAAQIAEIAKNVPAAVKGIYSYVRARKSGQVPAGVWAQAYERMLNEGGQTGYRDLWRTSEDRGKDLVKEIKRAGQGRALRSARAVMDWLSDYNETIENGIRLSVFHAAVNSGMTPMKAAELGKNITTNFNRKGALGNQIGAWYAFFNAAIQGNARMLETLTSGSKAHGAAVAGHLLGKAGRNIIAGGIFVGVVQAVAMALAGFDEDDPPQFVRERNYVIPTGDGKYILQPMPLGYNILPNIGRHMTEYIISGFRDPGKRAAHLAGLMIESFNPLGTSGVSTQTVLPTLADPLAAVEANRDFTGRPIYQEDFSRMDPTPGHTRARSGATDASIWLSELMNTISGGTDYKPGSISPPPDAIDYLVGQATGGTGRELMKLQATAASLMNGSFDELPWHKTVLAGQYFGDTGSVASVQAKFYDNVKVLNGHKREIEGRSSDGRGDTVSVYIAAYPEAAFAGQAGELARGIGQMRKEREQMVAAGAAREVIQGIDQRAEALMREFNAKVATARQGGQ